MAKATLSQMSARDLCLIMKACKDAGVRKFTFDTLSLEFSGSQSQFEPPTNVSASQPQTIFDPTLSAPETLLTPQDKELLQEAAESQLLIDDPAAFEEHMIGRDVYGVTPEDVTNESYNTRPRKNL